jgi:hypothetical protein
MKAQNRLWSKQRGLEWKPGSDLLNSFVPIFEERDQKFKIALPMLLPVFNS